MALLVIRKIRGKQAMNQSSKLCIIAGLVGRDENLFGGNFRRSRHATNDQPCEGDLRFDAPVVS